MREPGHAAWVPHIAPAGADLLDARTFRRDHAASIWRGYFEGISSWLRQRGIDLMLAGCQAAERGAFVEDVRNLPGYPAPPEPADKASYPKEWI